MTTPPTVEPTVPAESGASISSLSPTHGAVGSEVTINGRGFGANGAVQFDAADDRAGRYDLDDGKLVVRVPTG